MVGKITLLYYHFNCIDISLMMGNNCTTVISIMTINLVLTFKERLGIAE